MSPPALSEPSDEPLGEQRKVVAAFKKAAIMVLGLAMQRYGEKLTEEQEILSWTADILIDTFLSESAVLRALQAADDTPNSAALQQDAAAVWVNDAAYRIEAAARSALAAMDEGDSLRINLGALRRLLKVAPVNTTAMRRRLADAVVDRAGYSLG